ncbi:MAG: hypothetical protein JJU22_06150, partial [Gammaproteobacteria bacterium]|nr:hypothetical protein [Gammaproteobacteria bacterium]
MGERYFAQRNAPICVTSSEGSGSASAKRIEIGPIAARLGPSHKAGRCQLVGERYFAQRNAPIC